MVTKLFFPDLSLSIANGDENIVLAQLSQKTLRDIAIEIDQTRKYVIRSTIIIGATRRLLE
jgi:hypothetical protein